MGKLDDRVAIVTGGARGIGRALVAKLAGDGARVVANDLDPTPLDEAVAEIASAGGDVTAFPGDVTEPEFGAAIVDATLEKYGDLHIVVNNAGYVWNSGALKQSDEQWQAMFDVHATAPFRLSRAAGSYFRELAKRGDNDVTRKIVNVSSISGLCGAPTQVSYSAAKAALVGMTKTLCKEWGHYNVTVNCVAFGHIDTRLTQRLDDGPKAITIKGRKHRVGLDPAVVQFSGQMTPLGRAGTTEEAAGGIYLLCIPESDYISGQILVVSGGRDF